MRKEQTNQLETLCKEGAHKFNIGEGRYALYLDEHGVWVYYLSTKKSPFLIHEAYQDVFDIIYKWATKQNYYDKR